jgi:hypothetical protein
VSAEGRGHLVQERVISADASQPRCAPGPGPPKEAPRRRAAREHAHVPVNFNSDGAGYVYINLPWIDRTDWHAFSLVKHPSAPPDPFSRSASYGRCRDAFSPCAWACLHASHICVARLAVSHCFSRDVAFAQRCPTTRACAWRRSATGPKQCTRSSLSRQRAPGGSMAPFLRPSQLRATTTI